MLFILCAEWTGKEIKFPENVPYYVSGQETLTEFCDDCFHKEYKILLFVDSAGCSSCRLKLFEWKQLIEEANNIFQGKVGFLLFFQPKDLSNIDFLFVRDEFDYPVFIDTNGSINRLNQFPQAMQYQCFLLDSENKILGIGNPVSNIKIWELYKSKIANMKIVETNLFTSVVIDKDVHDYGTIQKGSTNTTTFTITNTGNNPFIISRVSTSCGCTKVTWDKQPIAVGGKTTVNVVLSPDEAGSLAHIAAIQSKNICKSANFIFLKFRFVHYKYSFRKRLRFVVKATIYSFHLFSRVAASTTNDDFIVTILRDG